MREFNPSHKLLSYYFSDFQVIQKGRVRMTKKRKESTLMTRIDKIQVGRRDRMSRVSLSSVECAGDEYLGAEGQTPGCGGQTEPAAGQSYREDGAGSLPHRDMPGQFQLSLITTRADKLVLRVSSWT